MESSHYVSERSLNKINKETSSIMANGLHQFYASYCDFKQKLIERAYLKQNDDDFQALTAQQLVRPLIFLCCLCGVATFIFIGEIVAFQWKHRNSNQIHGN